MIYGGKCQSFSNCHGGRRTYIEFVQLVGLGIQFVPISSEGLSLLGLFSCSSHWKSGAPGLDLSVLAKPLEANGESHQVV